MNEVVEVESLLRRAPELGCEVLRGVSRRRIWSTEEKLRILAQSVAPGSSPKLTCRMHGVSSGQFYTWRKQFRTGELTGFVPVSIAQEPPALAVPEHAELPTAPPVSASRDIPFNKLVLSQSNVRRVKAGVSIEELADDIARRTLLQSIQGPVQDPHDPRRHRHRAQ